MEIGTYTDQSTKKEITVYEVKSINSYLGMGGMCPSPIKKAELKDGEGHTLSEAAIKYLSISDRMTDGQKKNIIREYEIMETLNHENVVKLYKNFLIENPNITYVVLVMELCESDLFFYMKNRSLSEAEIKSLFSQMVNGLAYLHSNNILHRDIKPQNILIKNSIIKVADFGISKITDATLNTSVGTNGFTAPEVLIIDPETGLAHFSKPADIFSLGVTLYYMYMKRTPWTLNFSGVFDIKIVLNHYKERVQNDNLIFEGMNVQIREDAKDLILKMLCYEKKERITLAEIINHPYMKYSQDLPGYFNEKIQRFMEEYSQDLPACLRKKIKYFEVLRMSMKIIYDLHQFCQDIQLFHRVLFLMMNEIHNKTSKLYWKLKNKIKHGGLTVLEWENFYQNQISVKLKKKLQERSRIAQESLENLEKKTSKNIKSSLKLSKSEMKINIKKLLGLYLSQLSRASQNNDMLLLMLLLISILEKETENVFENMLKHDKKKTIEIIKNYLS